jgi:hypothetical protein
MLVTEERIQLVAEKDDDDESVTCVSEVGCKSVPFLEYIPGLGMV